MKQEKKNSLFSQRSTIIKRQITPSIYALLGHETYDIEKLPVNQNSLTFKDESIERNFFDAQFYDHEKVSTPSKEFRVNLLIFFLYFSLFLISTIIFNVLSYLESSMPISFLIFKSIFIGGTSTLVYLTLYLLRKSQRIFRNSIKIITILGILIISTLIFTNDQVLYHIIGQKYEYSPATSLIVLSFIYLLKLLLFESFRSTVILSVFTISSFIMKTVILRSNYFYNEAYECFMISVILILICINCYRYEHTSRDVF